MTGPERYAQRQTEDSAGKAWTVRPCSAEPGRLSEGPRWDGGRSELLWVDVLAGRLHRARLYADGQLRVLQTVHVDGHLGAAAPAAGGGYVLAAGPGFLYVDSGGAVHELAQPEVGRTDVRMNDGACDPQGRFWAGTMAYDEATGSGCLYRLELDGSCTQVLTGLTISNGIGWSPEGTLMYLADSGTGDVDAFDFDAATGNLGRRRTVVHISTPNVVPDGLTVDHQGNIWVALGTAVRSRGTIRTGRCWVLSRSRSTGRHRARSATRAAGPCSSPRPGKDSTTPRWPGSPTPDACCGSTF